MSKVKQHPPEGIGDEVLTLRPEDLRELCKLPADVEIVGIVGPPPDKHHDWVANPFVYLHVCHKLAVRCPFRAPMQWTTLHEFCERIEKLKETYEI